MRIAYYQTKDDPNYGSCLWAYFDFDMNRYMLNIQSDAANGQYRWPEEPDRSFLRLMSEIDEEYLLNKLFHAKMEIDGEATVDELRCLLMDEENDVDDECLDDLKWQLLAADSRGSAELILAQWLELYEISGIEGNDVICEDYTPDQKRVAKIFMDYVQPRIKVMLESKEDQNK